MDNAACSFHIGRSVVSLEQRSDSEEEEKALKTILKKALKKALKIMLKKGS